MSEELRVRSPRLTQWVAFLIFSTITMGAASELSRLNRDTEGARGNANQTWAVTCSIITFILTLLVVMMHLSPISSIYIVGTKIEGVLCVFLFALWVSIVTIVSDSRNGLAVDDQGTVENANLYYFSWAGFVCSVTLSVSFLKAVFEIDIPGEIRTRSARLNLWSGLLATSIVVSGSSGNIFSSFCRGDQAESAAYCHRTSFGIALGIITAVMALYVVGVKIMTTRAPFMVEAVFSLLSFLLYIFGVAFITSSFGPGSPLGNLYYFTWLSFFLSFGLVASCYEDYQNAKNITAQQNLELVEPAHDIQIEGLDAQM